MKCTALVFVVALGLTACKGGEEPDDTDDTDVPSDTDDTDVPTDTDDTDVPDGVYACGAGGDLSAPDLSGYVPASVPSHVTLVDLGIQTTTCGFSEELTLEIPAGTTSVTFGLVGQPEATAFISRVVDPNGVELTRFDPMSPELEDEPLGAFASLQLNGTNPGAALGPRGALTIPNNDAVELLAGTYTVEIGSFLETGLTEAVGLDAAVHALAYLRTDGAAVDNRRMDLALYFSGSSGLDAALAQSVGVPDALDVVDSAMAQMGIALGEVTFNDLPPGFAGPLDLDPAAFDALLRSNTSGSENSLNVFFVQEFQIPGGAAVPGLLGLSFGLPGLPFSRHGGVIMGTDALQVQPELGAHVMAHEIGHYLGLKHTEESTGIHFDPLADTPMGVTNNLMFFEAGLFPLDELTLTEEQGRVARRHPLVYPAP